MKILNSDYRELCAVELPYQGRQKYMHSFDVANPVMAEGYEDYESIVRDLLKSAGVTRGIAHMTVDEKIVPAGMSQRRPRPHVDGCFTPSLNRWSHGEPSSWLHYCNDIQRGPIQRMAVIVAASVKGCRVWRGKFLGEPKNDGDLSHIKDQLNDGEILPANTGFLLSADCVHESMIMNEPTQRTFLRIALPVEFQP